MSAGTSSWFSSLKPCKHIKNCKETVPPSQYPQSTSLSCLARVFPWWCSPHLSESPLSRIHRCAPSPNPSNSQTRPAWEWNSNQVNMVHHPKHCMQCPPAHVQSAEVVPLRSSGVILSLGLHPLRPYSACQHDNGSGTRRVQTHVERVEHGGPHALNMCHRHREADSPCTERFRTVSRSETHLIAGKVLHSAHATPERLRRKTAPPKKK